VVAAELALLMVDVWEVPTVTACVVLSESFLRKREEGIRLAMHELHRDSYNEDEVILELEHMMADITKTRMDIPQSEVVLQKLSTLNSEALARASSLGPLQRETQEDVARTQSSVRAPGEISDPSRAEAGDGRQLITQAFERRNTYQAQVNARERPMKTTPSQVRGVDDGRAHPELQGHKPDKSDGTAVLAKRPRNFVVTPTQFNHVSRASNDAHGGRGHIGHNMGSSPAHGKTSISPQHGGAPYYPRRPPSFDTAGPHDTSLV